MTAEAAAPESDLPPSEVTPLPARQRLALLSASGVPLLLFGMAAPYLGLIGLPVVFFLKNRLHKDASFAAEFAFISAVPLFVGFIFGFIRDRWSPLRLGDRGHFIVFGVAGAAVYAVLAMVTPSVPLLLAGGFLVTALMQFVGSAANGLASAVGRRHAMSGQMSTVMNIAQNLPQVIAYGLGGVLAGLLEQATSHQAAFATFGIGALLLLAIAAFGWLGPRRLFADGAPEPASATPLADIRRLLAYWPIYPALLVQLLWQFGPGAGIALQFHMSNDLKATDAQVGLWYTIFYGAFIPVYVLYGWLAQRVSLTVLMWIGVVLAVPQMVPLLFVHSAVGALWAAAAMGALGGLGQPAFFDLCMRATPRGLEGSMMMLLWSMFWIANKGGDLWGADLYDHHGGFNAALVATVAVYAAIVPVLLFVPRRVTDGHDA
jgi:MFS family permease